MKIFVICDATGNIRSFAIPNPALAANASLEAPDGGRVHVLDVDSRVMTPKDLLNPKSEQARKKVYDKLRRMIARSSARKGTRR